MRENDYLDVRKAILRRARQLRAAQRTPKGFTWGAILLLTAYAIAAAAAVAHLWKGALGAF